MSCMIARRKTGNRCTGRFLAFGWYRHTHRFTSRFLNSTHSQPRIYSLHIFLSHRNSRIMPSWNTERLLVRFLAYTSSEQFACIGNHTLERRSTAINVMLWRDVQVTVLVLKLFTNQKRNRVRTLVLACLHVSFIHCKVHDSNSLFEYVTLFGTMPPST